MDGFKSCLPLPKPATYDNEDYNRNDKHVKDPRLSKPVNQPCICDRYVDLAKDPNSAWEIWHSPCGSFWCNPETQEYFPAFHKGLDGHGFNPDRLSPDWKPQRHCFCVAANSSMISHCTWVPRSTPNPNVTSRLPWLLLTEVADDGQQTHVGFLDDPGEPYSVATDDGRETNDDGEGSHEGETKEDDCDYDYADDGSDYDKTHPACGVVWKNEIGLCDIRLASRKTEYANIFAGVWPGCPKDTCHLVSRPPVRTREDEEQNVPLIKLTTARGATLYPVDLQYYSDDISDDDEDDEDIYD